MYCIALAILSVVEGATSDHTTTVQDVSPVTVPSAVESRSSSTTASPVTPETVSAITASSGTLPVITTNTTSPLPCTYKPYKLYV